MSRVSLIILLFIVLTDKVSAQKPVSNLKLEIRLPAVINNNEQLNERVTIYNSCDTPVIVFKELHIGKYPPDFADIVVIVEKKGPTGYRTYIKGPMIDPGMPDSAASIAKILLKPGDSVVNFIHLDGFYEFDKGNYRAKCMYRNDLGDKFEIESNWVYFTIKSKLFVKHHFD